MTRRAETRRADCKTRRPAGRRDVHRELALECPQERLRTARLKELIGSAPGTRSTSDPRRQAIKNRGRSAHCAVADLAHNPTPARGNPASGRARRPSAPPSPIREDCSSPPPRKPALEPDRPIIDPHHHLWDRPGNRYLFHDLMEDLGQRPQHPSRPCFSNAARCTAPRAARNCARSARRSSSPASSAMSASGQIRHDARLRRHHRQCRFPRRQPRQGHPGAARHPVRRALPRHPQRRHLA